MSDDPLAWDYVPLGDGHNARIRCLSAGLIRSKALAVAVKPVFEQLTGGPDTSDADFRDDLTNYIAFDCLVDDTHSYFIESVYMTGSPFVMGQIYHARSIPPACVFGGVVPPHTPNPYASDASSISHLQVGLFEHLRAMAASMPDDDHEIRRFLSPLCLLGVTFVSGVVLGCITAQLNFAALYEQDFIAVKGLLWNDWLALNESKQRDPLLFLTSVYGHLLSRRLFSLTDLRRLDRDGHLAFVDYCNHKTIEPITVLPLSPIDYTDPGLARVGSSPKWPNGVARSFSRALRLPVIDFNANLALAVSHRAAALAHLASSMESSDKETFATTPVVKRRSFARWHKVTTTEAQPVAVKVLLSGLYPLSVLGDDLDFVLLNGDDKDVVTQPDSAVWTLNTTNTISHILAFRLKIDDISDIIVVSRCTIDSGVIKTYCLSKDGDDVKVIFNRRDPIVMGFGHNLTIQSNNLDVGTFNSVVSGELSPVGEVVKKELDYLIDPTANFVSLLMTYCVFAQRAFCNLIGFAVDMSLVTWIDWHDRPENVNRTIIEFVQENYGELIKAGAFNQKDFRNIDLKSYRSFHAYCSRHNPKIDPKTIIPSSHIDYDALVEKIGGVVPSWSEGPGMLFRESAFNTLAEVKEAQAFSRMYFTKLRRARAASAPKKAQPT